MKGLMWQVLMETAMSSAIVEARRNPPSKKHSHHLAIGKVITHGTTMVLGHSILQLPNYLFNFTRELSEDLEEFDEAEETLSFCDLPIYADDADWNDSCSSKMQDDRNFSSSSSEIEFFEFSSVESLSFGPNHQSENIIFCGKLITPKEDQIDEKPSLLQYKLVKPGASFNKSKPKSTTPASNEIVNRSKSETISRSISSPASKGDQYDLRKSVKRSEPPVQRAPLLRSPTKTRRRSPLLGLARIPAEMEMSDIKSRQRRRRTSTTTRSLFDGEEEVAVAGKSSGKGIWGVIRALGCWGLDPNAAVKATFSYVSPV